MIDDAKPAKAMSTLVTGSTGFIGSALVEAMIRRRDPVIPTVRQARQPGDIVLDLDAPLPAKAFEGVGRVVHLAGLSDRRAHTPSEFERINHAATVRLAHAAADAGVRHFIWSSSVFVHGDSTETPIDVHAPLRPVDSYARSKRDAETELADISDRMRVTILRLPLVLATTVARRNVAERLVRLLPVIPVPSPTNRRSFVGRETLVQQLIDLVNSEPDSSQVTIPSPDGVTSFEQVLRSSAEAMGANPRFVPIPRRAFAMTDAIARRLGRPSLAGLYTDFEVTGSTRSIGGASSAER